MKTLILFCSTLAAFSVQADTPQTAKVAILNFQNVSRFREEISVENPAVHPSILPLIGVRPDGSHSFGSKQRVDRYAEKARSLLGHVISALPGIQVIEREHVDSIEAEYERNRALGGRRTVNERPTRQHGPDFLVLGKILDLWKETTVSQSYGISSKSEFYNAQIYIRVVLMSEDREVYSTETSGVLPVITTAFGSDEHSDPYGQAISAAIVRLGDDPVFKKAFTQSLFENAPTVPTGNEGLAIGFESIPRGARVDIDGVNVGLTPLSRRLLPGNTYAVRVTKPGFLPWEARVLPERGLQITAELEKSKSP